MTTDPDFDRPGFNDLVTPFIFVKHGDPDPVAWKQAHPGWVSFPATFVPYKRPPPKWTVLNGKRWPLDKKGMPWPRSVFGQPLCPLNEYPPGVPAPGTQGAQQKWEADAVREAVRLVGTGELTTEWFLAEGARHRAERAARAAASPSPPPPEWDPIKDPLAPVRTYQDYRAREADVIREVAADPDGLGSVRDYRTMMQRVDASMRDFAEGARQRIAARAEPLSLIAAVEQRSGEEAQVADEEKTEPPSLRLPPGSYYEPLVPLMKRILAVREGEDVSALRREISAAFYAKGDVTGGNQVNMYLSELVEAGVTDAQRREIAAALAHYAKADSEEMGYLRRTLMLGAAGSRRPPRMPRAGDPAPDPNAPRVLTREDERAIRQHEKNIREHEEKLERYKNNLYSQDNENRLRNAPNEEIRQKIMRARIKRLEQEIIVFRENIRKITGEQK